ncbi:GPALPP motifs-containing protein 1 [Adelges cooleyi]|uniref:GPALPP motifs-containing protein 1 n=1 Tax=Adelges cooleyi TaxID=133065 RepID=UPI00217F6E65|nr:GPALPP motifs-containing protein 1 [Adelges cooleyi]
MGKSHKKHKKHKRSKDTNYPTPIVPLKNSLPLEQDQILDEKEKKNAIGPIIPSCLLNCNTKNLNDAPNVQDNEYGPKLPPHLVQKKVVPGPSLPPGFEIPENIELNDDTAGIGPLPDNLIVSDSEQIFIQKQLELRAEYMKRKFAGEVHEDKTVSAREMWMLELPPEKAANIGLGARQFRKREGPDMSNRSEWTETPHDKQKKVDKPNFDETSNMMALKQISIQKRDQQMEKLAENSEKRKPYSLVEMHQEKLKKEKKEKSKEKSPQERRPFSREIDLQSNRFDNAQKQSILKKASLLDSRFSQGESRFL